MSHYQKRELLRVVRNGNVRRLSALLAEGVNISFLHRKTGMTPLMTAAYAGLTAAVQMLLDSGASPNLTAEDGASSLHWASLNKHLEIVNLLIAAGAKINVRREKDGPTPLHMAINNANDSIAIALINAGASLDIEYLGRTVLEYAEWCKQDVIVRYIRERRFRRSKMST